MLSFEWYSPSIGAAAVSMADYGLTFSSGAVETLGRPEFVMLGFDVDQKIIGVKKCENDDPRALEFASRLRKGYVRISSKDFIRFIAGKMPTDFGIEGKAVKYFTKWDKDKETLEVHLSKPVG